MCSTIHTHKNKETSAIAIVPIDKLMHDVSVCGCGSLLDDVITGHVFRAAT